MRILGSGRIESAAALAAMIFGRVMTKAVMTEKAAEIATPSPALPVSQSVARKLSNGMLAAQALMNASDLPPIIR